MFSRKKNKIGVNRMSQIQDLDYLGIEEDLRNETILEEWRIRKEESKIIEEYF